MTDTDYAVKIYCKVFDVATDNGDAYIHGVLEALCTLNEREQTALRCYYREKKTYKLTAEILGTTVAAVQTIISEALDKLSLSAGSLNLSVVEMMTQKELEIEKATAVIDELYDQLETAMQGGSIAPKIQAILESRKTSIYSLGVSSRTCILLSKAGIRTVESLLTLNTLDGLMKQNGFGPKSRDEIIRKMREHGYSDWAEKMKV